MRRVRRTRRGRKALLAVVLVLSCLILAKSAAVEGTTITFSNGNRHSWLIGEGPSPGSLISQGDNGSSSAYQKIISNGDLLESLCYGKISWSKGETSKVAKITTREQKDTKTEKTSVAEEKTSGLIAKIEEEERAATKEEIAAEEELMEEITGLIIEQTMTRIGYEFYENFFLLWEAPEEIKDYNIFINERAGRWGSWVRVVIDTTTVWSKVLKPRTEEIEEAVKQAVEVTKDYLYHREEYEFQTEDMVGTGI